MTYELTDHEQNETIFALRSRIDRLTASIEEASIHASDMNSSEAYRDAWEAQMVEETIRLLTCEHAYKRLGGKLLSYQGVMA